MNKRELFENKIEFLQSAVSSKTQGCINWPYSKNKDGYGWLGFMGQKYAHRAAYVVAYGEIYGGLNVLHTCDNPACINPLHLFLGTHQENMIDKKLKGRSKNGPWAFRPTNVGENHGKAKLTDDDVREIRKIYGELKIAQKKIAEKYGVSRQTINDVITNTRWKHVA